MAKYTKDERDHALDELHKLLRPGSTVYTKVDHVARSGMTRWIECYVVRGENIRNISWMVATATGSPLNTRGHYGVEVGGCGMDMGFHLVYSLARSMWPQGFRCAGKSCPSNDHVNARRIVHYGDPEWVEGLGMAHQPGYLGPHPRDGRMRHRGDGGYALNQRWF